TITTPSPPAVPCSPPPSPSTTHHRRLPMSLIIPGVHVDQRVHSHVLQQPLAAQRGGVMLHYDDSSDDESSLAWFRDPRCSNGYTWLVLDDARVIELADPAFRTPHAGPCLTPRANSVCYGVAAATNGIVPAKGA